METALFIVTFVAGFFLGVIALGGVLAALVRKHEKQQKNTFMDPIDRGRIPYEPTDYNTGPNPFQH